MVNVDCSLAYLKGQIHQRTLKHADDSPVMTVAVYLYEKIKGKNLNHRKPNLQSSVEDIRKMNEIDKRPFEKTHKMLDWYQVDTFW